MNQFRLGVLLAVLIGTVGVVLVVAKCSTGSDKSGEHGSLPDSGSQGDERPRAIADENRETAANLPRAVSSTALPAAASAGSARLLARDAGTSQCGSLELPNKAAEVEYRKGSPPPSTGGRLIGGSYYSTRYIDYRATPEPGPWRARLQIGASLERMEMIKVSSSLAVTHWSGSLVVDGSSLNVTLDCPDKSSGKNVIIKFNSKGNKLTLLGDTAQVEYEREP